MTEVWAGLVSLVGGLIVIALFVAIAVLARRSIPEAHGNIYKARRYYAIFLVLALVGAFAMTLPRAPYVAFQNLDPVMTISVTGKMWSWQLKADRGDPDEIIVPLGKPVQFDVTAEDVNHGFGIYGPDGNIVTQTQAMPGYVNRLQHTFEKPGTYHVLCLEFCGLMHHAMLSEFTVR